MPSYRVDVSELVDLGKHIQELQAPNDDLLLRLTEVSEGSDGHVTEALFRDEKIGWLGVGREEADKGAGV